MHDAGTYGFPLDGKPPPRDTWEVEPSSHPGGATLPGGPTQDPPDLVAESGHEGSGPEAQRPGGA